MKVCVGVQSKCSWKSLGGMRGNGGKRAPESGKPQALSRQSLQKREEEAAKSRNYLRTTLVAWTADKHQGSKLSREALCPQMESTAGSEQDLEESERARFTWRAPRPGVFHKWAPIYAS